MAGATAVIGRATRVQGRVTGEVDLDIRGIVRGEIAVGGEVTIDSGGMVDGNVTARRLVVRGAVKGDLLGRDAVLLEDGARVVGDVRAPRVAIASGALLRGLVEADPGEGSRTQSARDQVSTRMSPARDAVMSKAVAPPPVRKPMPAKETTHTVAAVAHTSAGSQEVPASRGSSAQAHPTTASHVGSPIQGANATNHVGARRPPPPVLPSLKRARGQIVKKKER